MEDGVRTITIAGGGLAGLSLGIGLRRQGVPVVLCEAGSYPRHRVCGEFISGVREETLEALGVLDLLEGAMKLQSTSWSVHGELIYEATLPEAARGISRFRLDHLLAERFVDRGGQLWERERMERCPRAGLVWAAGRRIDRKSRWLGLKVQVEGMATGADLEMHLGEGGYAGVARIEEGRVNVCGLFRRRAGEQGRGVELLRAYLESSGLGCLWEVMEAGRVDGGSFVGVSAFRLGRQVPGDGLCAVGDAESMIPPLTGNGMSMAFEAAEEAMDPMRAYAVGELDWEEARRMLAERLRERFSKRLFTARLLHSVLLRSLGQELLAGGARWGILPFDFLFRSLR